MGEKFILLCNCGWKRITDLENCDLVEIKNDTLSARKFRCTSCGFAVTPRKTKDPQLEMDRIVKEKELEKQNREWLEESMERREKFIKEMEDAEEDINK